jgi:hypothetical protein
VAQGRQQRRRATDGWIEGSNVVFIKTHKCSSSTFGGIVRALCLRYGNHWRTSGITWMPVPEPFVWASHARFESLARSLRSLRLPSLRWTVVRLPGERCLSKFYHFDVSRGNKTSSAANKRAALHSCQNRIHKKTRCHPSDSALTALSRFHFVGLTERFDESLIALKYQYNLSFVDIAYLSAKDPSVTRRDFRGFTFTRRPPLSEEPRSVQQYVRSNEFAHLHKKDLVMWRRANALLDEKLEAIPTWRRDLSDFKQLLSHVQSQCPRKPCLYRDNGCGYKCIAKLGASFLSEHGIEDPPAALNV